MIVTKLVGGLGNQLFQYAAGRYLAHKHNTELKLVLDNWFETATSPLAYYRLNEFNIQASFASEEEIKSLQVFEESARSSKPADTLFNPKFLELPDNVILSGYWQSEKYFKGVRNVLLEELTLKNPLGKNSAQWKEKILAAECAVSIQV